MGKNDVVRHNLTIGAEVDWGADAEPIDMRRATHSLRRTPGLVGNPPNDTMIRGQSFNEPPYQSIGKLRMKFPIGRSTVGSGWVVARRAFITAGHCVHTKDRGGWINEGTFCPRFNLTCERAWTVETVLTLQGWLDDEDDRQFDLAACIVTEAFTDKEPPLPFRYYTQPATEYVGIGYPRRPSTRSPFNGKRMWQSYGKTLSITRDNVIIAENGLTGGGSGGPWIEGDSDDVGGVNSYREDDPDWLGSPMLLQGFKNLYEAVKDL